ncbi:hypothetical protein CRU85_05995 [Staphylococcus aureus]|nr:hypothetical protein CRU85_05995 [Staphylococcus aureus]
MYNVIYIGSSWRGPNTEAGGKSANNIVQVGGAPTQKQAESQLTILCKLAGPQHKSRRKVS